MSESNRSRSYWKANLVVVSILMSVWFVVGFGFGIFGIEWLNGFQVGKVGLGFWIAQQGSIFAFVAIVFTYAICMDWLDRKYGVGDEG